MDQTNIVRIPWHRPRVTILEWPIIWGPMQAFHIILKDGRGHIFRSEPVVSQTFRTFDAVRLVRVLIDYYGVRRAFLASECMSLDQIREVMGEISNKSLGGHLGEIAGENIDGYVVEKITEERGVGVWWVCKFS